MAALSLLSPALTTELSFAEQHVAVRGSLLLARGLSDHALKDQQSLPSWRFHRLH